MFVNHKSQEINFKVSFLGDPAARTQEIASYIYEKTSPGSRSTRITLPANDTEVTAFSFIPLALGKIRNFDVRLHVYALSGELSREAHDVLAGTDVFILAVSRQASFEAVWPGFRDAIRQSGRASWTEAVVLLVEGEEETNGTLPAELPHPRVVRAPNHPHGAFASVKEAVKLALNRLKTPEPEGPEPVVPVAVPPLFTLLSAHEAAKGAPLSEAEATHVREEAVFVMLPEQVAQALGHGRPVVRPEHVWEDWQQARRALS